MAFNSAIKVQSGIKNRAEEGALVADDALSLFRIFERRQALGIGKGFQPVLLVRRQAGEAEHRQADIVGTLGRQKVTVMRAAKLRHQGDPQLAVMLEFLELARVEYIADMAGDHGLFSHLLTAKVGKCTQLSGVIVASGLASAASFKRSALLI